MEGIATVCPIETVDANGRGRDPEFLAFRPGIRDDIFASRSRVNTLHARRLRAPLEKG
jgi:hypothetical protein